MGPDGPLGTVVSVLGLGGIWNAGAIPPSRGLLGRWRARALHFAAWGIAELWRVYRGVAVLTAVAFTVPCCPTPVGLPLMRFLVAHAPGVALFRDTHKLVRAGHAWPDPAAGGGHGAPATARGIRQQGALPAGVRLAGGVVPLAVGALVIATVPGYPRTSPTAPQRISPAWAKLSETISGVPRADPALPAGQLPLA